MFRKVLFVCFLVVVMAGVALAWTNCPPAALPSNPKPVVVGGGSACIAEASWVQLNLNENWTRQVELEGGKSYWFAASKCARAYSLAGEVKDSKGVVLKSGSGPSVGFCFRAPKTGVYSISYRVTGLKGMYSFAITNACLSMSNCSP